MVDLTEYNEVYICKLGKNLISKNSNDFGPIEGESSVGKFAYDFEVAFNQELKKSCFCDIEFSTYQQTDPSKKEEYEKLGYIKWAKFMVSIRPFISSKIGPKSSILERSFIIQLTKHQLQAIY